MTTFKVKRTSITRILAKKWDWDNKVCLCVLSCWRHCNIVLQTSFVWAFGWIRTLTYLFYAASFQVLCNLIKIKRPGVCRYISYERNTVFTVRTDADVPSSISCRNATVFQKYHFYELQNIIKFTKYCQININSVLIWILENFWYAICMGYCSIS